MRILIIGSGGREHALAWKLKQSPLNPEIFIAPGNGGTALEGVNVAVSDGDIPMLMQLIAEKQIDFVVPGPELPLVKGIVDACDKAGVLCFGPSAYAAQLEGSKAFAKTVMREAGVPTADFAVFNNYEDAENYVLSKNCPLVVKADGLASGKGVVVAKDSREALDALRAMMVEKIFGLAGETVVIEETLIGEEATFLCFCQGETVIPLPSSQDHKAAFDGDTGPNTGGMGAYSPAPVLPDKRQAEIIETIVRPVMKTLEKRGCPYTGILYVGLMMTSAGGKVLEFNVRFGDPECQPILMRLRGDLLEVMMACAKGRLHEVSMNYSDETALCVVLAAKGYPGPYKMGMNIDGIAETEAAFQGRVKVFQAGTRTIDGAAQAVGGRVLGVTALGADLAAAQKNAYEAMAKIRMEDAFFRRDIGSKGLRTCWACD